uniref:Lipase EstA/Esterase EstB family-containing protein n=1 Tax=Parastrongyloides trichosuri TaxID=131310 RepID=A0A0N4Z7W8_PARTI
MLFGSFFYIFTLGVISKVLFHNFPSEIHGPITEHFKYWLIVNGYRDENFIRNTFDNIDSFGGKNNSFNQLKHRPIIFIHGNSDGALSDGTAWGTGWNSQISFFKKNGYTSGELYGITWGSRNSQDPMNVTFSCYEIKRIRRFIFAVLEYTRYDSVNIIAHSMGVTMVRKAIKGGYIYGLNEECLIDGSISRYIHTFIAISGANYGLAFCGGDSAYAFPACNIQNGFWPGNNCYFNQTCNEENKLSCNQEKYSRILQDLNEDNIKEARNVYTIFTPNDELIGDKGLVCGNFTSRLPIYDKEYILDESDHMRTKDETFTLCHHLITESD